MRFEPLGQKMFTRRNWLLRCSILINVAVLLYIGSYMMIGGNNNITTGSGFFMQDEQQAIIREVPLNSREPLSKNEQLIPEEKQQALAAAASPAALGGNEVIAGAAGVVDGAAAPTLQQAGAVGELDPNIGDPAAVIGNIVPEGSTYVNNTNTDGYIVTGDEKDFDDRLRAILKCYDRPYESQTLQRGDFWVLQNYVRAEHGELKCHESITYTTHADYTFLDNLIPLLER